MAKIIKDAEPFERFEPARRRGPPVRRRPRPGLQGRAHRRRAAQVRRPQLLPPGRVRRPLPRAAHPPRRQGRRVQAPLDRRGLLEGRRRPQAAPARSTAPRSSTRRSSTPTSPSRGGQEARPPRARQAAQAVHHQPAGRPGPDPVDAQGGDRPRRRSRTSSRTSWSSAAISRSTPRTSASSSCTRPAATSRTTGTPSSRRCSTSLERRRPTALRRRPGEGRRSTTPAQKVLPGRGGHRRSMPGDGHVGTVEPAPAVEYELDVERISTSSSCERRRATCSSR